MYIYITSAEVPYKQAIYCKVEWNIYVYIYVKMHTWNLRSLHLLIANIDNCVKYISNYFCNLFYFSFQLVAITINWYYKNQLKSRVWSIILHSPSTFL